MSEALKQFEHSPRDRRHILKKIMIYGGMALAAIGVLVALPNEPSGQPEPETISEEAKGVDYEGLLLATLGVSAVFTGLTIPAERQ